ncbi:MAG: hypothetical protein ABSA75_11750 [Candidatus Bathyarchaeia archaeon]|jgi:hypothetical protein
MRKWLEKYAGSLRFWILIVAAAYFGYAVYYAASGMRDSIAMISNQYIFSSLSQNPWWWMVLFYGSEGVAGSVAIITRAIAGVFAVYAAFLFWRKKDATLPAIRKNAGMALLLEAVFFFALIPSIIAAIAYNSTTENLFYFGHTPGILLLYITLIPCLAIVLVVPPLLLKLRATIISNSPREEIIKFSCLTGVGYLFTVFWFNYLMSWIGTLVPYPVSKEQYGLSFLLEPVNLTSFVLTVFGLLALALTVLVLTLPAIKKQSTNLNLTAIGFALTAFGAYFLFSIMYFYLTGSYPAHPSVWYEIIGPTHNPNLWAVAFIFIGVPVLVSSKIKKREQQKKT